MRIKNLKNVLETTKYKFKKYRLINNTGGYIANVLGNNNQKSDEAVFLLA